jgi:2-oxoglutarate/2-oxoacid ferredoxin oxidoreductase subunit alpha
MDTGITIKITGEAGQGIQTIGSALSRLFKLCGLHIFANQDYMSRIRGGNNFFQLRISDRQIFTLREKSDIIITLDKKSVALHKESLNPGGVLILDKKKFDISQSDASFFDVPIYELATNTGGSDIFLNTVSCGVVTGMTKIEFKYLQQVIQDAFADKGDEIIKKNIAAAQAGFDFSKNNFQKDKFELKSGLFKDTLLMNGNEAIALGAIRAGCKFYSAYPMSPSTGIMEVMAHYAKEFNIIVEQAEDEIAAINMIIGASFSGVRSLAATSGGGFALMVEGLSLAGMTETPIVVVDAQRPAPATGFPTRTEQADLDFLIHAGHGEFARVVYAPGTIEEAFYLAVKAFNIAEKYQIPVLIMSDQHLADSYRDIGLFDLTRAKVNRYIISKDDSKKVFGYKRYQFTPSGVSLRAVPSWVEDCFYADSDEHNEEGHITEDAEIRIKMVEKRFYKKLAGLSEEIERPTTYNLDKADTVLLGFGSTLGVIKEACSELGESFGFMHFSQVWPFPAREASQSLHGKKNIFTVENNAGGQLAGLLMRQTGIKVNYSILRFDGRPFNLDYLIERIKERRI